MIDKEFHGIDDRILKIQIYKEINENNNPSENEVKEN